MLGALPTKGSGINLFFQFFSIGGLEPGAWIGLGAASHLPTRTRGSNSDQTTNVKLPDTLGLKEVCRGEVG